MVNRAYGKECLNQGKINKVTGKEATNKIIKIEESRTYLSYGSAPLTVLDVFSYLILYTCLKK